MATILARSKIQPKKLSEPVKKPGEFHPKVSGV
jgi:hypothetical protein